MRGSVLLAVCGIAVAGVGFGGGLAGATSGATALDGQWRGSHKYAIAGSLEGGFTVSTAESWTLNASIPGCFISSGKKLATVTASGGGRYSESDYTVVHVGDAGCTFTTGDYGTETVTVALTGSTLQISGCTWSFCDTMTRVGRVPTTTATRPTTTATTTRPPATTTPTTSTRDTGPPSVEAFTMGTPTYPGQKISPQYAVRDDSGHATVHLALYQGGTLLPPSIAWDTVATGQRQSRAGIPLAAAVKGPLFFCVWATDAAGHTSAKAPKSSCAWIKLVVAIEAVSNGCGTERYGALPLTIQNYFGNLHRYHGWEVNFKVACDLHDAGYGGYAVRNEIHGGITDYRHWSRAAVDIRFRRDMQQLCRNAIKVTSGTAATALVECLGGPEWMHIAGPGMVGAETLYSIVDRWATAAYDADLTNPDPEAKPPKHGAPRDSFR